MSIEDIFNEDKSREERVNSIRDHIRSSIDEASKKSLEEKFGKKKKEDVNEEDDKSNDEDDQDDDKSGEEDEEDEESESETGLSESLSVEAHKIGSRNRSQDLEKIEIKRLSDLSKLAKTRKYDYFVVKGRNGRETDYTVDPQGNLVEM